MKLEAPIKINVSALKNDVGVNVSIDQVRDDLQSMGAEVTGDKEPDGTLVMYIGGDIEYSDIETCFDEINVDVDDYIIEDDTDELVNECDLGEADELGECDKYPTFENALAKFNRNKRLNEKKKDCCPKKKVINENKTANEQKSRFRGNAIPLSEALNGDYKKITKKHTLNDIIDSMTGRTEQRKINQKAIQKAMNESKTAELSEQLGQEKSQKIIDAIKNGRKTMYEKVSINKKAMVDYTVEELTAICEKLEGQIATLKEKNEGLNEADSAKIQNQISKKEHLIEMIHDEIDFRNALQEANDEDLFGDAFPNMNPNAENKDGEDEKKDDEKSDEKSDDSEEEKKDDEDNPDEDKKVEIGSIVITLDSKEHAEDLKTDLLDAGVPEEAIEISPAKEEDKEDSEEEKKDEENTEENSEKQEESVKTNGKKLNEDDEESNAEDAPANDTEKADDDAEGGEDENKEDDSEPDGAYTLTLVDTNYAEKLQDVFNDVYGITPEEFSDMIGGDIVGTTEDENGESEEDKSDEDNKDAEGDDNVEKKDGDDVEELNPDDIFKDL